MKTNKCNDKKSIKSSGFCQEYKDKRDIEWKTCKHCGAKDGENSSNWVIDSCCRKCNKEIEAKIDFNHAKENGDVTRDDSIMCPYCGDIIEGDIYEYSDDDEFYCDKCNKVSDLNVEATYHYTTTKKDEKND